MVFLANIHQLGTLPKSEMKETSLFKQLPQELTYPNVTPKLMNEAAQLALSLGIE